MQQKTIQKTVIYSIIPSLIDHVGHFYEYHVATTKAFKINRWISIKLVPKNCSLSLPRDWKKTLAPFTPIFYPLLKKFYHMFFKQLYNIVIFVWLFRKIKKRRQNTVLFGEFLGIAHLISLLIAYYMIRPNIQFWILQRFEADLLPFQGKIHRIVLRLLACNHRMTFFGDTEQLAAYHCKTFGFPTIVLPIPHTANLMQPFVVQDNIFLWPGESTREEKGLSRIKTIASLLACSHLPIQLMVSKNIRREFLNQYSKKLVFLPATNSRWEYEQYLKQSKCILFPYISERYRCRSSGIFVEAVVLGKVPFVTANTWMACELQKFELSMLIVEWEASNILDIMYQISQNAKLLPQLSVMASHYRNYHTVESLAKILKG